MRKIYKNNKIYNKYLLRSYTIFMQNDFYVNLNIKIIRH